MNHLDLFSGIGGFSLAAQRVWGKEHNIVAFCENDKYCQEVLKKHWPDVFIYEKIEELNGKEILAYTEKLYGNAKQYNGEKSKRQVSKFGSGSGKNNISTETDGETKTETIDLCTFGWPCQPFSVAGKRKGKEDDRYLWPEAYRVIQETNPTWLIGENVPGIIGMELDNVLSDLEGEGYETQTFIIPACAVDARHKRNRVWIVANSKMPRNSGKRKYKNSGKFCYKAKWQSMGDESVNSGKVMADSTVGRCEKRESKRELEEYFSEGDRRWPTEPNVGRVAHGIPSRVDRLKALGNSIVPQVVMPIMLAIKEIEDGISQRT